MYYSMRVSKNAPNSHTMIWSFQFFVFLVQLLRQMLRHAFQSPFGIVYILATQRTSCQALLFEFSDISCIFTPSTTLSSQCHFHWFILRFCRCLSRAWPRLDEATGHFSSTSSPRRLYASLWHWSTTGDNSEKRSRLHVCPTLSSALENKISD